MLDGFPKDTPRIYHKELLQYCKMENVSLAEIVCVVNPKRIVNYRFKSAVSQLLRHLDKILNAMIDRLSIEAGQNSIVQGRLQ